MVSTSVNTNFSASTIINLNRDNYHFVIHKNAIIFLNEKNGVYHNALNILSSTIFNKGVEEFSINHNNAQIAKTFLNYYHEVENYAVS